MEDFGAWLIACTKNDNTARRAAEAKLLEMQNQDPQKFLYELARYFTSDDNAEAARLLACVIFRNSILRSESRQAWVAADAQFKQNMRDHILPALGAENEEIARYVCIVVGALAAVDLPRGEWIELIPSISRVLESKQSLAPQIAMTLRTFQYICSDLESPSQITRQQRETILSGIVKIIIKGNEIYAKPTSSEDPQISIKSYHQALKSLLEGLHFINITLQEEKDTQMIIKAVVDSLGSVTPVTLKETAMQCIQAIAEDYYEFLNQEAIASIATFTEQALKEANESINILILGFWEEIAEIEFKLENLNQKHLGFSKQAGMDLIKIVISEGLVGSLRNVAPEDAGKPGFDGDDWNQYKASCECCLSLVKVNRENVYEDILQFFKNNITSETWQHRNASLIAFSGFLVKDQSTVGSIELVANKLEAITNCLDDPIIEVRSSASWVLSQICQCSAPSILDYGSNAVNMFLVKLLDHLKDEAIVANHICRVIYDFFQAIGAYFQQKGKFLVTDDELIFRTIEVLITAAYRRDYDPDDVSLAQGAFLSLVGVVANITSEQFGNCVLVPHSDKSVIDLVANLLKSTTEQECYFPLDSTSLFPFHSPQERANFQEHLSTLLTEMFLRGANMVDSATYLKPMNTLVIQIFQARQEAFRQGILLLGALALCSQGNYDEEFLRVKEYLEFALNSQENRELVLSGCEMMSNVAEAMGESLGVHLESLLPPIVSAIESKKIFIEEKIAACEALGELAIHTGAYVTNTGKMPWATYAKPSVEALLELAAKSFRALGKKNEPEKRQLLFKLLRRIVETLSCIFYNTSHPSIGEALVSSIPQVFRLSAEVAEIDTSIECTNLCTMLVADILDIFAPLKPKMYLQQHFPRFQDCANRLMTDENYKSNGLWAIQQI